jgi:hypothetical protein
VGRDVRHPTTPRDPCLAGRPVSRKLPTGYPPGSGGELFPKLKPEASLRRRPGRYAPGPPLRMVQPGQRGARGAGMTMPAGAWGHRRASGRECTARRRFGSVKIASRSSVPLTAVYPAAGSRLEWCGGACASQPTGHRTSRTPVADRRSLWLTTVVLPLPVLLDPRLCEVRERSPREHVDDGPMSRVM